MLLEYLPQLSVVMTGGSGGGVKEEGVQVSIEAWPGNNLYFFLTGFFRSVKPPPPQVAQSDGAV